MGTVPWKTVRHPHASRRRSAAERDRPFDSRSPLKLAMELMGVPGASGREGAIIQLIRDKLIRAGIPSARLHGDNVHRRSPLGGEVGNLICRLPGTIKGPRRLMLAHVDTVPLCVGSRPRLRNGFVESADLKTALGADDRAGAAVLLQAAIAIARHKLPHPPLTFCWMVQEEVGLLGARHVSLARLGRPRMAFNFDGGLPEKVTLGATGAYRIQIDVEGIASHAGAAPECGVSAIAIASLAIADLQRGGWLGDVRKNANCGTSNFGFIHGGGATNVVPDRIQIRGECRSHDPGFRKEILAAIETAFRHAAAAVRNREGASGRVTIKSESAYDSFVLRETEPCVVAAVAAVQACGRQPQLVVSNGGLDANWLTARGLPTVTLGCGQRNAHMLSERLDVSDFHAACRIALRLATGTESSSQAGPPSLS
jgi:tripeptide aminopeptidase